MRTMMRIGLALLMALGVCSPSLAQDNGPLAVHALVGPSFANVGTTFSTVGALDFRMSDALALTGEAGILPRAPFGEASEIAVPATFDTPSALRVNAYHWNGNIRVRPVTFGNVSPYLTAGAGVFSADTVGRSRQVNGAWIQDRRRVADFATNIGAGAMYRATDWLGVGADYRTFFVHRDTDTPRVHRFTAGVSFLFD
jgi:opacity protein-like surface antigen